MEAYLISTSTNTNPSRTKPDFYTLTKAPKLEPSFMMVLPVLEKSSVDFHAPHLGTAPSNHSLTGRPIRLLGRGEYSIAIFTSKAPLIVCSVV